MEPKKKRPWLTLLKVIITIPVAFVLFIAVLTAVQTFFGDDDEPEKIGQVEAATPDPAPAEPIEPIEVQTEFGIGEMVEMSDIVVTLTDVVEEYGAEYNSPAEGKVFVACEFDIQNGSASDIAVVTGLHFEAYVDDYAVSESFPAEVWFTGKHERLDGSIAAEKKKKGVICYELPVDYQELEIQFKPSFWNGNEITFVVTK